MIRVLLFALLFTIPAVADDVFMNNTTSESNMCVIDVTGQTASTPSAVAHANWSPITYNCAAGTYLPADGVECVTCTAGNYCIGGNYTYNETTPQGLTACATNYTSSAGASICVPMTYNITYILNGGSSVPSTYTQLEYLEATGRTQYIDTGLRANIDNHSNYRLLIKRTTFSSGEYNWWLDGSALGGRDGVYVGIDEYIHAYYYGVGNDTSTGVVATFNVPITYDLNIPGDYYRVTDEGGNTLVNYSPLVVNDSNFTSEGLPLYVFGYSGEDRKYSGRIYYAKIYYAGTIVRDFIPARRNSDNVLGMYDTVTNTFFTNDGTGTFVAGPNAGSNWSQYTYGTGATMSATPTRAHSAFAGWCDDVALTSNCATPKTIGTTATGDKTFYAKYLCDTGYSTNVSNTACNANTITVNWDNGAGGATQNTCTYGGDLTTPTTAPTKRGHVFTGWSFNLN